MLGNAFNKCYQRSLVASYNNQISYLNALQLIVKCALLIDLVLIAQQSVGKRSLHMVDTVNAKKRWTTINWRSTNS
jgi:hypothetical protein